MRDRTENKALPSVLAMLYGGLLLTGGMASAAGLLPATGAPVAGSVQRIELDIAGYLCGF